MMILKQKNFIVYWLASAISAVGDKINDIVVVTLIFSLSASNIFTTGNVFIFIYLAIFLTGILGGIIADKFDRKKVAVILSLVIGGIVYILSLTDSIILIYVLIFIITGFENILGITKMGIRKEILPDKEAMKGITILSVTNSVINIAIPSAIGVLLIYLSYKNALLIDVGTFAIAAILILFIKIKKAETVEEAPTPKKDKAEKKKTRFLNIRRFYDYLLSSPQLKSYILIMLFFSLAQTMVFIAKIDIVLGELNLEEVFYGGLLTAITIGGLAGSILAPKFNIKNIIVSVYALAFLEIVSITVISFSRNIYVISAFYALDAFFMSAMVMIGSKIVHTEVKSDFFGRFNGIFRTFHSAIMLGAIPLSSFMLSKIGYEKSIPISVAVTVAAFLIFNFIVINKEKNSRASSEYAKLQPAKAAVKE